MAVNLAEALDAVGGDREILVEVARVLVAEAPEQVRSLAAAVARRDVRAVRDAAHKLKGSLGVFRAEEAHAAARALESAAGDGRLEELDALFAHLREQAAAALDIVRWLACSPIQPPAGPGAREKAQ